jgi:hypothetical protein
MDRRSIAGFARTLAMRCSRRGLRHGLLGTVLVAAGAPLADDAAHAGKKRCRPKCKDAERCQNGTCRCQAPARRLRECHQDELDASDGPWCAPTREGNPRLCCPARRIYVNCPLGESGELPEDNVCRASDEEAPAVCCAKDKVCGRRCCEKPFVCVDPATSTCSGHPPTYARLKRAR